MKLSENKFLENVITFSPIFKYTGIIITWYNLINSSDENYFFSIFEKKIGLEVFLLCINFILISLGQNSKKKSADFKLYIGIFIIFSLISLLISWNDNQILISVLILLISNLLNFLGQSSEYGSSVNDIFMSGRGSVFCFALAVIYGIPIGLLLKHFNLWESITAIGYAIIAYYVILLFFEIRFLLKNLK